MNSRGMPRILAFCAVILLVVAATDIQQLAAKKKSVEIDFEKYTLGNGLEVVLHEDHSDPIVSVSTLIHVGSSREKPGRTGFAHFFEHMSFNDSENVPRGANRKMIPELGGLRNGGTSTDYTVYYEVVPKDALEKIMWIASDRLGYMINTVTVDALEREKQVVKNEKLQRCDNAPYGYTDEVQRAALYPNGHPYSWTVLGSLPDLLAASLEDVKEFYLDYYGSNNATLVIAGDIDIEETKQLVEKWFGEIKKCRSTGDPEPRPARLEKTRSLYHLDNFAKLPELQILWPAVPQFHEDSYALSVLAEILAGSKKAPLYRTVVEERSLAPSVSSFLNVNEIAGAFNITVRGNTGTDLDDVKSAVEEAFSIFEEEGVPENELKRIKAQNEIALFTGISTVQNKTLQLAIYNEFTGDPGFITVDAKRTAEVKAKDVRRVYEKYIRGKPFVMTSFVPKDEPDLVVSGAVEAEVSVDDVTEATGTEQVTQGEEASYEKTPSKYDRSEPPLGDPPLVSAPEIWREKMENGLDVLVIESSEVPMVEFYIPVKGGHFLDPPDKSGTANLLALMFKEGTKNRTSAELEEALGMLGATVDVYGGRESILFYGNCLSRNFEEMMGILSEMILEPRFDEADFERLKVEQKTAMKDGESNPRVIARLAFNRQLYGDRHINGTGTVGTPESVEKITLGDIREFYDRNISPSLTGIMVAGDVSGKQVKKSLKRLRKKWKTKDVTFPSYDIPVDHKDRVFFVDMPGSSQSTIIVGKIVLSALSEDYNNLKYAHQVLGRGSSGRLFQVLRVEKGFTYGAYSYLRRYIEESPLLIRTAVRANATEESLQIIRSLVTGYRDDFGPEEMAITKNKLIKGGTRAFEPLRALAAMLYEISFYDKPIDYVERDQKELVEMDLSDFHRVIDEYLDESKMLYLVVGDAETQLKSVEALGYGTPVMLDAYGNRLEQ